MVRKKKKSKPLNAPKSRADHGTPEALRQADGVQYETVDGGRLGSVKRAYISRQTPMDRYKARGLVSQRQYDAAHAFFVLYDKTRQAGRVTSNYDRIIVDGGGGGAVAGGGARPGPHALNMAKRIAEGPTFANGITKTQLQQEWNMSVDQAIESEAQAQAICMQHPDFREA